MVVSHGPGAPRIRITVIGGPSPLGSARGTAPCTVIVAAAPLPPPLSSGCLAGVTRALALEAGLAVERPLPLATFRRADEAFLTSTTRLGQPIRSIDGRQLPPPGPATAAVQAALAALVSASSEP